MQATEKGTIARRLSLQLYIMLYIVQVGFLVSFQVGQEGVT